MNTTIDINNAEVLALLKKLIIRSTDLSPVMRTVASIGHASVSDAFDQQQSPDGTPWAPWSPQYAAYRNKKTGGKILSLKGLLRKSITESSSKNEAITSTNTIYARVHHLGGGPSKIPARPFMALSPKRTTEVLELIRAHLVKGL